MASPSEDLFSSYVLVGHLDICSDAMDSLILGCSSKGEDSSKLSLSSEIAPAYILKDVGVRDGEERYELLIKTFAFLLALGVNFSDSVSDGDAREEKPTFSSSQNTFLVADDGDGVGRFCILEDLAELEADLPFLNGDEAASENAFRLLGVSIGRSRTDLLLRHD